MEVGADALIEEVKMNMICNMSSTIYFFKIRVIHMSKRT